MAFFFFFFFYSVDICTDDTKALKVKPWYLGLSQGNGIKLQEWNYFIYCHTVIIFFLMLVLLKDVFDEAAEIISFVRS